MDTRPDMPSTEPVLHPVRIVGAGPGHPELITRRGWRCLGEAEVIFYDALLDQPGFLPAAPEAEWVPVGKRAGQPSTQQAFIGRLLLSHAQRGRKVVRLKGGDPSIFGRLSEELSLLHAAGIPTELVPGVTAATASAAELQLSLTARGLSRSLTLVTPQLGQGQPSNDHWVRAVCAAETAVLYMAGRDRAAVAEALLGAGLAPTTPVAVVENASRAGIRLQMRLCDLALCDLSSLTGPVCLLLGEAIGLGRPQAESATTTAPKASASAEITPQAQGV